MNKIETLAMVDVAEHLIKENKEPMTLEAIFKEVARIKNISLEDVDKLTQLYMDITQSGKFVYCGEEKWNLKIGNLHLWDDDGSSFIEVDATEVEPEEIEYVEIEENEKAAKNVAKKVIDKEETKVEVEATPTEAADFSDEDYDEEDYNKYMDQYEDMYED